MLINKWRKIKWKTFELNILRIELINWSISTENLTGLICEPAETVELKAGEFKLIPLGVAMELPKGYEAPCGSTQFHL